MFIEFLTKPLRNTVSDTDLEEAVALAELKRKGVSTLPFMFP